MAATIDATPGGPSATCYVSEAEAGQYMDERQAADAWNAASTEARARALISATRALDRQRWRGQRASAEQALQWPRYGAPDPDAAWGGPGCIDASVVPARLKRATCELAYAILAGTYSGEESGLDGFELLKIGPITIEPRKGEQSDALPDTVRREIVGLLAGGDNTIRLLRG